MLSRRGRKIGKIIKQCSSAICGDVGDEDGFGVNFPLGLDVKKKALLIGASVLIVSVNELFGKYHVEVEM